MASLPAVARQYPAQDDRAIVPPGWLGVIDHRPPDEIGTPYCITIDFDTLEDDTVTIRDRDTMEQIRLPISEVENYIKEKLEI